MVLITDRGWLRAHRTNRPDVPDADDPSRIARQKRQAVNKLDTILRGGQS